MHQMEIGQIILITLLMSLSNRKLNFTLSKQTLSYLNLTCIRPTLEYACEVWDGCFEREVAKLEKVQLESARIVSGLK